VQPGLEGVVVAETVLSHADAKAGMLWVRGHSIPQLVDQYGFEGTVALLWDGFAGDKLTRAGLLRSLGAARQDAFARLPDWLPVVQARPLDEAIRIGLALLPDDTPAAAIVATFAVYLPAFVRAARGEMPVPPDAGLPTSADVLRMLHGKPATEVEANALETYFTVMVDTGMSTSAFAGRTVASTRASLVSAVLAAWAAFTGPLHGGAPGPTLDMLDQAEAAPDLDAWLEAKLRSGERIMGFGHRVFRGNDPRVAAMRKVLSQMGPTAARLEFAIDLERRLAVVADRIKPGRKLLANVEITAALLLDAVGFPREAFTAAFAITRSTAWIAHALEQQKTGRMIRPSSEYVGPKVG
jgi:citrate synthase